MVTIGVLSKGRSLSWPLLRLAGIAASAQLVCGIRPYMGYAETKRKHADGPSRDHPIGVAPPWFVEEPVYVCRLAGLLQEVLVPWNSIGTQPCTVVIFLHLKFSNLSAAKLDLLDSYFLVRDSLVLAYVNVRGHFRTLS